jgi:hypothetical protein
VPLACQECDASTDEFERGWQMRLAPDPDDPGAAPLLGVYCPPCGVREFGPIVRED